MSSRNAILARLREVAPTPRRLPDVPMFDTQLPPAVETFRQSLDRLGGVWCPLPEEASLEQFVHSRFPGASVVCSATSGALMRLVVHSGIRTSPLSFLVTQAKAPRGTEVAMVGTRASCQPMPVLMMFTPAPSSRLPNSMTSSKLWPSGTRSIMERR